MTTPQIPEGYKADSRGRLIPIESIKPIDIERDNLVAALVEKGRVLSQALAEFRALAHADIAAFADLSAEKYGANLGGKKGNITLASFDGRYKVIRAVADQLAFDERLQAAKTLIDSCLHEWTKDSGKEVRTLINDAFQVDQKGKVNTNRVLQLRRLEFDHPKWKAAMEAIHDSLLVATSRNYIRLYERIKDTDQYRQINLDLANATASEEVPA